MTMNNTLNRADIVWCKWCMVVCRPTLYYQMTLMNNNRFIVEMSNAVAVVVVVMMAVSVIHTAAAAAAAVYTIVKPRLREIHLFDFLNK